MKLLFILISFFIGIYQPAFSAELTKWKSAVPLNAPKSGAAAVAYGGYIYVLGGIEGIEEGFSRSGEMAKINPDGSLGNWKPLPEMNYKKGFASGTVFNGYIYVVGGSNFEEGSKLLDIVERAQIKKDATLSKWEVVSRLTTPRRGATAISHNGKLFVIGGYNGIFLSNVETASIDGKNNLSAWSVLPSILNSSRYIHGAASLGNMIYVVGGHKMEEKSASNSSEYTEFKQDGTLKGWSEGPPLNTARFLTGVASVKDTIVVVGGYSGEYLNSVELAEINKNGSIKKWKYGTNLQTPREGASVVSHNNVIYAIGGSNKGKYLKEVEYAFYK